MKLLVSESFRAWQSLGEVTYGVQPSERESLVFRRSLYIARDMKKGDVLNSQNLRAIRPGHGLSPKYYELLIGKVINRDIARGTPVSWDLIG